MKPECEAAIRAAAGGREITDQDLRAIESRLHQATKTLRRQNPEAWENMSASDRLAAAAKLARASHLEQMAAAHRNALDRVATKLRNDALIAAIPPGKQIAALTTTHFLTHGKTGDASLEAKIRALQSQARTQFTSKEERALDDPSLTLPIAQELRGVDSGNAEAKALATKVAAALERWRLRRERAGIPVNRLENYASPQPWDWTRFAADDENTWVKKHLARVDPREFVNSDGSQMSPERIEQTLREAWLTLHTNGANKRAEQTGFRTGGRVGGNANAPRQLHFKDAESWLASMKEYGVSDVLGSILREHFGRVARDVAIAEHEGPMADADVRARADRALANDLAAANTEKAKRALVKDHASFLRMWEVQSRGHSIGNASWAARMGAVRSLLSASRLGSLVSQQPSDPIMAMTFLHAVGLDRPHAMGAFFKGMADSDRKDWLRRASVWSDNAHDVTSRFGDTEIYNRASKFLNGTVYKMSGMRAADRMTTSMIAESVLGSLGKHTRATPKIEDLPEGMASFVKRYGITQEHWDVMRRADLDTGAAGDRQNVTPDAIYNIPDLFLRDMATARAQARNPKADAAAVATEIARLKDETVTKILGAFHEVYHAAGRGFSGSSLMEQKRLGLLSHDAGTPMGEAVRMFWMIRQVPAGLAMTHLFDVPRGMTGYRAKASYIVRYVLGQALATGIAVQLKHVINGEDPENMETLAFAKKLAAGAVIGPLISSLVFGSQGEHAALGIPFGPAGDALQQLESLVMRGRDELNGKPPGEKDHFDSEKYAAQWLSFVRSNAVPFANVWYVKSVFNHLIYQQLQEATSPGYNERVQRRLQRENRNTWWSQGDVTPQRAPDFGAATGQPTQ